jgi:hypothetical protein
MTPALRIESFEMIEYKNLAANWQILWANTKWNLKVLDSLKIAKFEDFAVDRNQAGMTRYKHRKIDVVK